MLIDLGVSFCPPRGAQGLLLLRSSTGVNTPLRQSNHIALIDNGYRGSVKLALDNTSDKPYKISRGDRLAQIFWIAPKKEALLPSQKIIEHTTIKFLSFNLSLSKPYSDIRLKEFMKLLPKYDIICLQGISSTFTNQQIDLIQEATRNSFFFSVTSEQPSSFSSYTSEYGLIILSRFPIEKYAYIPFKNTCHQEKMIQKGFLYAKVNIKGNSRWK